MSISRNRFRVRLMWLLRALALRCCAHVIFRAAFSRSWSCDRRDVSPQERTNAAIAVCNWQTVSSGFFPPPFLTHSRQEQVAHAAEDQVSFQSQVTPSLVLVQTDLAFLVLEATFHSP